MPLHGTGYNGRLAGRCGDFDREKLTGWVRGYYYFFLVIHFGCPGSQGGQTGISAHDGGLEDTFLQHWFLEFIGTLLCIYEYASGSEASLELVR